MTGRPNRGSAYPRYRSAAARVHENSHSAASRPTQTAVSAASDSAGLPLDWESLEYLALDFETTGLDPRKCRVVEIGALRFKPASGYEIVELGRIEALVNPEISIPAEVVAIHGIRDADVASEPRFAEHAPGLVALAKDTIIIAHNAPFDLSFLREELARNGLPACNNAALDTRLLAKAAFPGLGSYRLTALAAFLGITPARSHRAFDDARTCATLFMAAARLLAPHTMTQGAESPGE